MEISIAAEKLFSVGSFQITNSFLTTWLVMACLVVFSVLASRKLQSVPSGLQNFAEWVMESLFNLFDGVTTDRKLTKKFFPICATIFLFVIIANWTEILPGLGSIGIYEEVHHGGEAKTILVPFLRSPSADLNFTLAIALISVFSIQFFGIAIVGFFKYFKKFINFRGPINFFVGILELISEVSKLISFSLRLFGNIFAGEVLLMVMAFLVPFLAPIPFYLLEIFVGLVQALIFSLLTLVFLTVAAKADEH